MPCGQCTRLTPVFALALPEGSSRFKKQRGAMKWTLRKVSALLADVEYLPPPVASRIQALTPHYRLDRARKMPRTTWVNHCEHCEAMLADYAVHDMESGEGPFDMWSDPSVHV